MLAADRIIVVPPSHDWLDHLWGWSQVGGALLAAVALGFAWAATRSATRSAQAADASADAAARMADAAEITAISSAASLELAREELQMLRAAANRRPVIQVTPAIYDRSGRREVAVLELGLSNTGDAEALQSVVNVVVPVDTMVMRVANARGENGVPIQTAETSEDIDGSGRGAIYIIDQVDIRPKISAVAYYMLIFEDPGRPHPIRVSVTHPNAEPVSLPLVVDLSS